VPSCLGVSGDEPLPFIDATPRTLTIEAGETSASGNILNGGTGVIVVAGDPQGSLNTSTGSISHQRIGTEAYTITFDYLVENAGGMRGNPATVTIIVEAERSAATQLDPPASLAASYSSTAGSVALSWQAPAGQGGFTIFRDGVVIGSVGPGTASFQDAGPVAGASHSYQVRADGPASGSPISSALTSPIVVQIPASPEPTGSDPEPPVTEPTSPEPSVTEPTTEEPTTEEPTTPTTGESTTTAEPEPDVTGP
jgi:hypothetical protein